MSQAQKIPFLNLFSAWRPGEELAALAGGYLVTGVDWFCHFFLQKNIHNSVI